MCTVSMVISDWNNPNSPNHIPVPGWSKPYLPGIDLPKVIPDTNPLPGVLPYPPYNPQTVVTVTPDVAQQMLEILKRVDALDKKLGRLDCILGAAEKKGYVKALKKLARKKPKKAKRKVSKKSDGSSETEYRQLLNE